MCALSAALVAACMVTTGLGISFAGQKGHFTMRSEGKAVAQTLPDFGPVAGELLHIRTDAASAATATSNPLDVTFPYAARWWFYVTAERYDDFLVYQSVDAKDKPTDVTIMLREAQEKLPPSPDDWRGMVWIHDANGCQSVTQLRRPGWHHISLARKGENEVEVEIDRVVLGSYAARSPNPAEHIQLGDLSTEDGAGEAYWGRITIAQQTEAAAREISVDTWNMDSSAGGTAEQRIGFEKARRAHLYLQTDDTSRCDAKWGDVRVNVPYQFWCQFYVSEQPYESFCVICPLDRENMPTDFELQLDDTAGSEAENGSEGLMWVVDAEGRHNAGPLARGVWHNLAIRRRSARNVDLLIDDVSAGRYVSRSPNPVTAFRFGDFSSQSNSGEAYWYKLRLVQVPEE